MDLTEVRVRGKRSQEKSSIPASSSSRSEQSRKRTRTHANVPLKELSIDSGSSPLERLPNELLEIIFLKSLNINFPRSSLSIGKRLASDHVKTELFSTAFSGTSDFEHTKCLSFPLEASDQLLDRFDTDLGVREFRNSLLALRWMTPWVLRHLMKQLCIRKIVRLLQQQNLESFICEQNMNSFNRSRSLTNVITELYESVESDDQRWSSITSREWKWLNNNTQEVVHLTLRTHQGFPHITSVKTSNNRYKPNMYLNWEAAEDYSEILTCVRGCRIPQKVLHGPWNIPKCTMLAQLSKAYCDLDLTGTTADEEVADDGLRAAIMQPSIQAIVTLVGSLRHFRSGCTLPECKKCKWGGDRCEGTVFMFHVGIKVNSGHLKLALAKDSSIQVLECLLDAMNISVDWSDNDILAWIVEKRRVGDPRGQFVFERYVDLLQARRSSSLTHERQKDVMSRDWITSKPSWLHDEWLPNEDDFEI